jgi:hypothetical protein
VQFVGNVQALQQDRGIALGGVAIFFAYDAFQFAELHAICIGHVVPGIDSVSFLHGGPEPLVAHDDSVDHTEGIEGELVLTQNAQLPWAHHRSFLGVEFAAEQLHERGLPGPVGAGQAIALARRKRRGDFFKQYFGAVAHGHIAD